MKVDPDIGVRIDVENRLDTSYLTLRLVVVSGFLNIYPTFSQESTEDDFRVADNAGLGLLVATSAFVGTNPTGELITSDLPVTRPESSRSARIHDQTSEIKREFTGPLCAHFLKGTIDFREGLSDGGRKKNGVVTEAAVSACLVEYLSFGKV